MLERAELGDLMKKAANREWKQPKRRKFDAAECQACQQQSTRMRGGGDQKSTLTSDMTFAVYPAGFWSCSGPVLPHHDTLEWQCTSWTFNTVETVINYRDF